jgi:DNA-binding GntR family transcriptional regulator
MKNNAVFKRSYNRCLDLLAERGVGGAVGSEPLLSRKLEVSRTTVRAVQARLEAEAIIGTTSNRVLLRPPAPADYFKSDEVEPTAELVERRFMSWMLGPECRPGQTINGIELARQFGVSGSAIRDCLNRFAHLGLLARQASGRWQAIGLDFDFVTELFDMREMMEFRAVERFVRLPDDNPAWDRLTALAKEHRQLDQRIETHFKDFSELDERFHLLIGSVSRNRFFDNSRGAMSLIFHYHYQWNKRDEKERNHVAVHEHLAYIEGLQSRDLVRAREACHAHLKTARRTLLASLGMSDKT